MGIRYATCSGLIPAGSAQSPESRGTRLSPDDLARTLKDAREFADAHDMELDFTSPGWLRDDTLRELGFTRIPSCGACLSNMAIAPNGTVLPCQSWLCGPGLGNILHQPWRRIWNDPACRRIRRHSAKMLHTCPLGETPLQEETR